MKQLSKLLEVVAEISEKDESNLASSAGSAFDNQPITKTVKKNIFENEAISRTVEDQNIEASSTTVTGQEIKTKRPAQRKKRYAKRKAPR